MLFGGGRRSCRGQSEKLLNLTTKLLNWHHCVGYWCFPGGSSGLTAALCRYWNEWHKEPNNHQSGGVHGEDCAVLDSHSKTWFDVPCDFSYKRICEMEPITFNIWIEVEMCKNVAYIYFSIALLLLNKQWNSQRLRFSVVCVSLIWLDVWKSWKHCTIMFFPTHHHPLSQGTKEKKLLSIKCNQTQLFEHTVELYKQNSVQDISTQDHVMSNTTVRIFFKIFCVFIKLL